MEGQRCDYCGKFIPRGRHRIGMVFHRYNAPGGGTATISFDLCTECVSIGITVTAKKEIFSTVFKWLLSEPQENEVGDETSGGG